jgi:tetratricopeptide (TPR) repeat protein
MIDVNQQNLAAISVLKQGDLSWKEGRFTEAIALYNRAINLDPHSSLAHQRLAIALKERSKTIQVSLPQPQEKASDLNLLDSQQNNGIVTQKHPPPEIAAIYLQQALAFRDRQEWLKAISSCREALSLDPQLAEAYKTWGDCLQHLGKDIEAIGYYGKCLTIKPDFAEVYLNLGSLFFKQQKWQIAIDYYQKAINIEPNLSAAYRNLARAYQQIGKQESMLDCWDKALELEPNRVKIAEHLNLGKILLERNLPQKAIAAYRRVIQLQPNSVTVYFQLAQALIKLESWAEAIDCYRQIIKFQPDSWQAYYYLGDIYARQKQCEKAVALYGRSLKLNPNCWRAYLKSAQILLNLQQWQTAVECCQKAISIESDNWENWFYLGKALDLQQQYQEAIEAYQNALKLNYDRHKLEIYRHLGETFIVTKQWTTAITCYQEIINREPDIEEGYYKLGEVAIQAEQWSLAVTNFRRAIELNPHFSWSYHHLGMALCELKQWQDATQILLRAIELNPDFSWSYFHLGDALANQSQWDSAMATYRYFVKLEPNAYGYERLGNLLERQANLLVPEDRPLIDEAFECYQKAIKLNPNYLQAIYKAIELQPYNPELYFLLARAYAHEKKLAMAITFYQIGLQINPNYPAVRLEFEAIKNSHQLMINNEL